MDDKVQDRQRLEVYFIQKKYDALVIGTVKETMNAIM